ncbi:probable disease resistance protein At5g43730 [Cornus florida]|uniref:probable disease resistance protein At5g43730 n=1 Tax=Cornus florida TaxID=4283 RepID=UPI002897873D|nr:probable disease resistance protein At5g43730 [Cornus florida]
MELIQPLYDIVKNMCTPICRRVDYAINLSKNFTELSGRVKKLCDRRDDIIYKIDLVNLQKGPTRECNGWLERVDEIDKKTKEDEQLIGKRCFNGWFPDVISRVKLGKHVVEMIEQVKELQEESRFEDGFVIDLPPNALIMGNSTNLTLQKIRDSIRDEGVQKIGIWGMGGVGKTTLMNVLNNEPEIQTMFHIVIWVTVSKSWSIRKIQDEVALRLSLPDVKDKPDYRVSIMLFEKLKGKKYLLLLDDVWEEVDLSRVGIPSTSQEKGCKIVLTTRDIRVCRKMITDKDIKVEVLDESEAWELFNSKAGGISLLPTIKPIAEKIVRKCGGLPLALKVAGGVLRMVEDVSMWRNFLNKLNSPAMSYIEDMNEDVFRSLKVSYDVLKDDSIKNCFLYCGLYPEDAKIKKSRLITYWGAEGFLWSKGTLEDAYDDGCAKLHDLIGASLLEKCEDEKHVKMHDVVRDLVLMMTSAGEEESRFMVRAGLLQEIPDDKEWEEASRISFMDAEGYKLPEKPKCPKLSTLLLRRRQYDLSPLKAIPECFFNHMPNLRLLDLSRNGISSLPSSISNLVNLRLLDLSRSGISSLPSSISNLVNLRVLLLKGCEYLQALPQEVGVLQRLEVLHVSRANKMPYHPSEMWKLTSLKSLKFSPLTLTVPKDEMVPCSVTISRLSLLQELSIKRMKGDDEESLETFAKGVSSLTRLSSLKFHFTTRNCLKHFLHNSQPWRDSTIQKFHLYVGKLKGPYHLTQSITKLFERSLSFVPEYEDDGGGVTCEEIKEVLIRSECFYLSGCETLQILSELGAERVNGLKGLSVYSGKHEYMIDEDGLRGDVFENLEYLRLITLHHFRGIGCDKLPMQLSSSTNSFTKLKDLQILRCEFMKKVFSWGLIPQLLNLESLKIWFCSEMEEIISADFDEREEDNKRLEHVNLPKLKLLALHHLRELVGFSKRKRNHLYLHCPSLEEVTFYKCPKLEIFPFGIDGAPHLRKIKGELKWWEALKWKDDATKSRFAPLFQIYQ